LTINFPLFVLLSLSRFIFAEQIPRADYAKMMVIDARDAGQFAKSHIPGAVNIEWRKVIEQRSRIPKNKMVLVYCNTGSLSAQAAFALRVAGRDNVLVLQTGFEGWTKTAPYKP